MPIQTNQNLDARGLSCPLPIIRTKKELAKLNKGEFLEILASDPGSVNDIASFCEQTGHELISSESHEGDFIFIVKKLS